MMKNIIKGICSRAFFLFSFRCILFFVSSAILLAAFVCSFAVNANEVTRWGAKITKADFAATASPALTFPEGWRLCEGENFTGINPREYYFTLEADGKDLPAPTVQVSWPNVEILRVYGGKWKRLENGMLEIQLQAHRPPTEFTSILPRLGAVSMGIFHNVEGLQAGLYRNGPYPARQIQAHLNYLFASREMMREMGFTQSADSVDGTINLYGFETNFPNGHRDFPPHFHIMLMRDSWHENEVCHFLLDKNGRILENDLFIVENGLPNHAKGAKQPLGSSIEFHDRHGKIEFCVRMLEDGTGLEMSVPGMEKQCMVQSENAVDSVSCYLRENSTAPWQKVTESRVLDDSRTGVLTVRTRIEKEGRETVETWNYDPHSGWILKP